MTAEKFSATLDALGFETRASAARFLGTNERTVRRWANDEWIVPNAVAMLLAVMVKHGIDARTAYKLGLGESFDG